MITPNATPSTIGTEFWITCFLFNFTGLTNNYLANELDMKGLGNPLTGFQPAMLYLAQVLSAMMILLIRGTRFNRKHLTLSIKYQYILGADLLGNVLYYAAMGFIGSGITTVLYSSLVVHTGIFSRVFFNKSVSWVRWICIIWIWASIGLSAAGQVKSIAGAGQVIGIICVLLSAGLFGLNFVLVDNLLSPKVSPLETAFFFWPNLVVCVLWVSIFDGIFGRKYVTDQIEATNSDCSIFFVAKLFVLFIASNATHQISLYYQLNGGKVAAVTAAINKSLQAVLVFVSSDLIYCPTYSQNKNREDVQLEQCINTWKLIGLIGTVLGVLMYSLDGVLWGQEPEPDLLPTQNYRKLLIDEEEPVSGDVQEKN